MPRPTDYYTHAQFEDIEGENDISRCIHCHAWKGTNKVLSRKKDHLLKCAPYLAWRAAGNGQDLQPPNTYNRRDLNTGLVVQSPSRENMPGMQSNQGQSGSPFNNSPNTPIGYTRAPTMNLLKYFDEFSDDPTTQKCLRVRCLHCGFVRAKNSTRQVEHLIGCQQFINSPEGQRAFATGELVSTESTTNKVTPNIFNGNAPNPNLSVPSPTPQIRPQAPRPPPPAPSLTIFLLRVNDQSVQDATQQAFLAQAGSGSLSAAAFDKWLGQQIHISRALVPFIGNIIGKVRIPETHDLQRDPYFRTIDLLVSAVTNMKKELEFIESTKRKYSLETDVSEPAPAVRGLLDLFANASCAQASLLEGLVCLFAIEHLFCISFQHASNFNHAPPPEPPSSYSLPSYVTGQPTTTASPYIPAEKKAPHILAIHEAFIQNWSSPNFVRFVGACKAIVDELANAQTSGNGRAEMINCERVFKQAVWLWNQIWPDPSPPTPPQTGADDDANNEDSSLFVPASGSGSNSNGQTGGPIQIHSDDDENDRSQNGIPTFGMSGS